MLALECTTITFFLYVSRAIERAPLLQGAARLGSAPGVETGLSRIAPFGAWPFGPQEPHSTPNELSSLGCAGDLLSETSKLQSPSSGKSSKLEDDYD
jgi:hypothetical protein